MGSNGADVGNVPGTGVGPFLSSIDVFGSLVDAADVLAGVFSAGMAMGQRTALKDALIALGSSSLGRQIAMATPGVGGVDWEIVAKTLVQSTIHSVMGRNFKPSVEQAAAVQLFATCIANKAMARV